MTRTSARLRRRCLAGRRGRLRPGDPAPHGRSAARAHGDRARAVRRGHASSSRRILTVADGLGPILNDSSCSTCHGVPARRRRGRQARHPLRAARRSARSTRWRRWAARCCRPARPWPSARRSFRPQADVRVAAHDAQRLGRRPDRGHPRRATSARASSRRRPASAVARTWSQLRGPAARHVRASGRFGWKAQLASAAQLLRGRLAERDGLHQPVPDPGERAQRQPGAAGAVRHRARSRGPRGTPAGLHAIDRQTNFQRLMAPPPQTPRVGHDGRGRLQHHRLRLLPRGHVRDRPVARSPPSPTRPSGPTRTSCCTTWARLGDGIVQGYADRDRAQARRRCGGCARGPRSGCCTTAAPPAARRSRTCATPSWPTTGRPWPRATPSWRSRPRSRTSCSRSCCRSGRVEFDEEGDHDVDALRLVLPRDRRSLHRSGRVLHAGPPGRGRRLRSGRRLRPGRTSPVFQRAMTGDDAALADGEGFIDLGRRDR